MKYIYFIILGLTVACGGLPPVPVLHPKFIISEDSFIPCDQDVNGKYICDPNHEYPLKDLKGFYAFPAQDIANVKAWGQDVTDRYDCKLKSK